MKLKKLSWAFVMILFSSSLLFSGCQSKQTRDQKAATSAYYTCSMHPQIHQGKPGNCPICGMKLIKIMPSSHPKESLDSSLSYLTEPVTQTVIGSFKVIEPVKTSPVDTIIAEGYIGFDERDVNTVNTRVTGRIEKLYVKYTNQRVRKRQPLMEIYSPELLSAQRDLLQAAENHEQTLISALRERLLNLGMQDSEIKKVLQNNKPLSRITIYSSYNGISRQTNPNTSRNEPILLKIREGMYVNKGQTVFAIQNINKTWAILNVFSRDLWHIHPGDGVSLYTDANPTHIIKGRVDFIPPYHSQGEETTRIRVYLDHLPQSWKIGTLIHCHITTSEESNSMYVPLSAVNRLGTRSVVWVQDKQHANVFHAREVKTGIQTSGLLQIISGIQPGDKIVKNAAYMVDSDSFVE